MAHLAHYKEAHPLPFVITHWINLTAMIFLIITGFIIHFPVAGVMGIARGLHVFFGFVIFINCVARVLMSFFIKSAPTGGTRQQVADFKTWLPQKLSYLLIPILIVLMFLTGLCLWTPTAGAMNWLTTAWGGAMSVRIIHYFLMYVFIIFIFIHVYLANVEGTEPTKLMFFHKEHGGLVYDPDKHVIVGDDTLKPRNE